MKKKNQLHGILLGTAFAASTGLAIGATGSGVADDFESYTAGAIPPATDWSAKVFVAPDPPADPPPSAEQSAFDMSQDNLFSVEAGVGINGSQGYSLNASVAGSSYNSVRTAGATGTAIILKTDFQITNTGLQLKVDPEGGTANSGTNDPFIGLELRGGPEFNSPNSIGYAMSFRSDGEIWGMRVPGAPFITGWNNVSGIGLDAPTLTDPAAVDNTTSSTSDWLTMTITARQQTRTNPETNAEEIFWETDAAIGLMGGPAILTSDKYELEGVAPDGTIFGGITTGFQSVDPLSSIEQVSKISGVVLDNFSICGFDENIDADNDGLNQFEEALAGTSDSDPDSDNDGFNDGAEVASGSNPLLASSTPLTGVLVSSSFSTEEGFSNGGLGGQGGWLGQGTNVDADLGAVVDRPGPFFRNGHSNGALGGTGGQPAATVSSGDNPVIVDPSDPNFDPNAVWQVGDTFKITFDYQLTLPSTGGQVNYAAVGLREVGATISSPTVGAGFFIQYNSFEAEGQVTGGSLRFFPDINSQDDLALALIVDASAMGLNPNGAPEIGNGAVDLESDSFRVEYVASITEYTPNLDFSAADVVTLTVDSFTVTNLSTSETFTYSGASLSSQLVNAADATVDPDIAWRDAFPVQQLLPNGALTQEQLDAGETNAAAQGQRTVVQFGRQSVNADNDSLTQAQEIVAGTVDGLDDTDNDGANDDVDPEPLNPDVGGNGGGADPILVTGTSLVNANTIRIQFTGAADSSFVITSSDDLSAAFTPTGVTATTNASGAGSADVTLTNGLTRDFFRVEESAPAQ